MVFKVYTCSYDYDYEIGDATNCQTVQNGSFPDLELAIAVATTIAEHLALSNREVGRVAWTGVSDDHENFWNSYDELDYLG